MKIVGYCTSLLGILVTTMGLDGVSTGDDSEYVIHLPISIIRESGFPEDEATPSASLTATPSPTVSVPTATETSPSTATAKPTEVRNSPTPAMQPTPALGPHFDLGDYTGCTVIIEEDRGNDGKIDAVTTELYGSEGSRTNIFQDDGADGTVDATRELRYGVNGRLESETIDYADPSAIDVHVEYNYDSYGRLTHISRKATGWSGIEFSYSEEGYLLEQESTRGRDANRAVTSRDTFEYAPDWTPMSRSVDFDADGVVDWIQQYVWNSIGRLRHVREYDTDGSSRRTMNYSYDESGLLVRINWDEGEDSIVDIQMRYTYEESRRLILRQRYRQGHVDFSEEVTYDDAGRILRRHQVDSQVIVWDHENRCP